MAAGAAPLFGAAARPAFGAAPLFGATTAARPAFGAAAVTPAYGAMPMNGAGPAYGRVQMHAQQMESLQATRRRVAGSDSTRAVVTLAERRERRAARAASAAPDAALASIGGHSSPAMRVRALRSRERLRLPRRSPAARSPAGKGASIAEKMERSRSAGYENHRGGGGGSSSAGGGGAASSLRLSVRTLRERSSPGGGVRGSVLSSRSRTLRLSDQRGATSRIPHVTARTVRRGSPATMRTARAQRLNGSVLNGSPNVKIALSASEKVSVSDRIIARPSAARPGRQFALLSATQIKGGYTTTPTQTEIKQYEQQSQLQRNLTIHREGDQGQWGAEVEIPHELVREMGGGTGALNSILLAAPEETESKIPEVRWNDAKNDEPAGLMKHFWLKVPTETSSKEYQRQLESMMPDASKFLIRYDASLGRITVHPK